MTKTIEQLSARVAELEAENARLIGRPIPLSTWQKMEQQLLIAQADNKRLRDTLVECLRDIEGGFVRCENCGDQEDTETLDVVPIMREALAQPSDTSALDAYVAEKVNSQRLDAPAMVGQGRFMTGVAWRTVIKAAQVRYEQEVTPSSEALRLEKVTETNILIKLRDDQIATLTRQRDLAIEALKWAADVLPPIDPGELGVCVCPVCRALEAIKESEAGRVLD